LAVARQALDTLREDRENHLLRIDAYERGEQDSPYMPDNADAEYRLLAERAVTNVMGFIVSTPAQGLYVDQFRPGRTDGAEPAAGEDIATAEWQHWQRSRMDGRQQAIYRGALKFGHSFVLTYKDKTGNVLSKGLSALTTTALYVDPANDDDPFATLHVVRFPDVVDEKEIPGLAYMWDDTWKYEVSFKSIRDTTKGVGVRAIEKHGASRNPVTRFTAAVDLEGRTVGVIEPMIPLQNRINQTIFDLLVVQSYASFKVRTISGMAPPIKMRPIDAQGNEVKNPYQNEELIVDWEPVLDPATGRAIPDEVNLNARRVFWAADEDTRFGQLDETPLDGFIASIGTAFQHMAALSQTPPHHLLGQVANLSAEALNAAESALQRKIEEFKSSFGESWERVFRIAAEMSGSAETDNFSGEVVWRDIGLHSLAQSADALVKMRELGIPDKGLWRRVPNVTANELKEWEKNYTPVPREERPLVAGLG
jgi:hypothetical protein